MTTTKIEWTDTTWNPVTGCTKVSPGCDNCYAERITNRFQGRGAFDTVTLHPDRLDQPLRWRKPRRVFVNSMSDLFHDDVPDMFIARVWAVMAEAPSHSFQVLTKRHSRMRSLLNSVRFFDMVNRAACDLPDLPGIRLRDDHAWEFPLPNVWLGVSVENQQWADIRIPALLQTPASVRFLSCEPLLGPVDLSEHLDGLLTEWSRRDYPVHWVIVGGESGPSARPMHPEWLRSLRDQCISADVPFFFKQWGQWAPAWGRPANRDAWLHRNGSSVECTSADGYTRTGETEFIGWDQSVLMRKRPKNVTGRMLDGRTWDEFPGGATDGA